MLEECPDDDSEWWLERETRHLLMPDGTARPFSCMRIHWGCFDFLVNACDFTPDLLVKVAIEEAKFQNVDLDSIFPDVMAFMDQEMQKRLSRD